MNKKLKRSDGLKVILLVLIAISIKIFSFFPAIVEKYYSSNAYQVIGIFLRNITGWLPFSIGDILYAIFFTWIIIRLYQTAKSVIKRVVTREGFRRSFQKTACIILIIYISFYYLWGLNYDRRGIEYQLQLQPISYTLNDIKKITNELITKVNASRIELADTSFTNTSYKELFTGAKEAYHNAEQKFAFLHYSGSSIKRSLYGRLGNYGGFLGYYNPFTGEAQVNVTVPFFVIPFTVCHEMAHQLGYATEDEANFVGYLAAKSSREKIFQYSIYFNLFTYANSELYIRDSVASKQNYKLLDTMVKKDILTYRKFINDHQNVIEPYVTLLYGKYLKANNQPLGIETYDEVVAWLIAYQKKYGEL